MSKYPYFIFAFLTFGLFTSDLSAYPSIISVGSLGTNSAREPLIYVLIDGEAVRGPFLSGSEAIRVARHLRNAGEGKFEPSTNAQIIQGRNGFRETRYALEINGMQVSSWVRGKNIGRVVNKFRNAGLLHTSICEEVLSSLL
jgi:hypothetical protein